MSQRAFTGGVVLGVLVLAFAAPAAFAQDRSARAYLPDPADEDWSFLRNAPKTDFWDPLKYIDLGADDRYATLSGEVRYRPEGFRVRATETRPSTIDNYLLQRYLLGADVRLTRRARVFTELQSGIINGSLRSPRPTDKNSIDLHQLFFEWRQSIGTRDRLTAKAGRHELSIGSSRLISASPGLNVKRSFDGVTVSYVASSWTMGAAAARLVRVQGGAFDDFVSSRQRFWGAAVSRRDLSLLPGEMGIYYLGIDRPDAFYNQGNGSERRHTVGVKWTATRSPLSLNYDGIFQWGRFDEGRVRAWAFATETGYQVLSRGWRPRVSVRVDIASGDRDPIEAQLEAFNPLFPGNSYSGAVGLLGPTNLTDLTPALLMQPRPGLTVGFEMPSYWRTSTSDGVYGTDLRVLIRHDAGSGKYVGTNPGVLVNWQATPHVRLQGAITRFLPGAFLEDTFVSAGFGFYSASLIYRF